MVVEVGIQFPFTLRIKLATKSGTLMLTVYPPFRRDTHTHTLVWLRWTHSYGLLTHLLDNNCVRYGDHYLFSPAWCTGDYRCSAIAMVMEMVVVLGGMEVLLYRSHTLYALCLWCVGVVLLWRLSSSSNITEYLVGRARAVRCTITARSICLRFASWSRSPASLWSFSTLRGTVLTFSMHTHTMNGMGWVVAVRLLISAFVVSGVVELVVAK